MLHATIPRHLFNLEMKLDFIHRLCAFAIDNTNSNPSPASGWIESMNHGLPSLSILHQDLIYPVCSHFCLRELFLGQIASTSAPSTFQSTPGPSLSPLVAVAQGWEFIVDQQTVLFLTNFLEVLYHHCCDHIHPTLTVKNIPSASAIASMTTENMLSIQVPYTIRKVPEIPKSCC